MVDCLPAMSIKIGLPVDLVIEEAWCNLIAGQTLGATILLYTEYLQS